MGFIWRRTMVVSTRWEWHILRHGKDRYSKRMILYGDNKTNPDLTAVKHVQEMQIIDGKDYEKIKEAVFKYGGVQTSIYNSLKSSAVEITLL